jgi:hypothetical protein
MSKRSLHMAGGGMAGDTWHWVVTEGRQPNRKTIASGKASSMADARKQAEKYLNG